MKATNYRVRESVASAKGLIVITTYSREKYCFSGIQSRSTRPKATDRGERLSRVGNFAVVTAIFLFDREGYFCLSANVANHGGGVEGVGRGETGRRKPGRCTRHAENEIHSSCSLRRRSQRECLRRSRGMEKGEKAGAQIEWRASAHREKEWARNVAEVPTGRVDAFQS